jgi:replication-associated recombination protein RarA
MALQGLNQLELEEILAAHLTPSKEIVQPDRLFGRDGPLLQIGRAFKSEGRNVFIFGDRGIGKTSLARTAATVNTFAGEEHMARSKLKCNTLRSGCWNGNDLQSFVGG